MANNLKSIKILCRELDISPRTLRYYEQEKIIESYQETPTATRQYDSENIDKIKKILFLRKLGLSIVDIKEIFNDGSDLQEAVFKRRATLGAEFNKIEEKWLLLGAAIEYLNEGRNIFELSEPQDTADDIMIAEAKESAEYLVKGEYEKSMKYFNEKLKGAFRVSDFKHIWNKITKGIGEFIKIDKIIKKDVTIYVYVRFTKLYVRIKYICMDGMFAGIWLDWADFEK